MQKGTVLPWVRPPPRRLVVAGETWGYTAAHTVTQAEIDSNGGGDGLLENTATADSNETGPDTDDASVPVDRRPSLNIAKDATVPDGTADAGELISYTITVANTGNVTLTNVTVVDPLTGENDLLASLAPGASHVFGAGNAGGDHNIDNTATAELNETDEVSDSAEVPLVYDPDVSIDKTAAIADGHADQAGDIINYTVAVTNTGNVTFVDAFYRSGCCVQARRGRFAGAIRASRPPTIASTAGARQASGIA